MFGFLTRQRVEVFEGFKTKWASPIPGVGHIDFKNLVWTWLLTQQGYKKCVVSAPAYKGHADVTGYDADGALWAYRCAEQTEELDADVVKQALKGQQEVHAAHAGVVSISGYTKQARELAFRKDVRLVMLK